jgi:hypothetical protein
MGILPMSITGVSPVSWLLLLSLLLQLFLSGQRKERIEEERKKKKKQNMGKMPMRLTGGTPVLRVLQRH